MFRAMSREDWIELELEKGFDRLYEKLGDEDYSRIDHPKIREILEADFIKEAKETYEEYLYERGASQYEDMQEAIYA